MPCQVPIGIQFSHGYCSLGFYMCRVFFGLLSICCAMVWSTRKTLVRCLCYECWTRHSLYCEHDIELNGGGGGGGGAGKEE